MTGIAVDDICFNDCMLVSQWNPQRQRCSNGNLALSAHVKSAKADVLCTGNTDGVDALKMNVDDQTQPIELPTLVMRNIVRFNFVRH